MAAAVVLPPKLQLPGVNDSKKLTAPRRSECYDEIVRLCIAWAPGVVTPEEIDRSGMTASVRLAFFRAASGLPIQPELFLVDGLPVRGLQLNAEYVVKGDSKSLSIASASILAKVTRDEIMIRAHHEYPGYDFISNKGYGTRKHLEALRVLGPTPIHRMSFAPLRDDGQMRLNLD